MRTNQLTKRPTRIFPIHIKTNAITQLMIHIQTLLIAWSRDYGSIQLAAGLVRPSTASDCTEGARARHDGA